MNDLPVVRLYIFAWGSQTVLGSPEGDILICKNMKEPNALSKAGPKLER